MSDVAKYELGFIKEIGESEAIINAAGNDYHILLTDDDAALITQLILNEDVQYVAFDTENEKVVFDNVFQMDAEGSLEVEDTDYGVDENGIAE